MEVRTELAKPLSPNRLALSRETTTLRVREPYPSAIQLLAKDAILLDVYSTTATWWRLIQPATVRIRKWSAA